MARRLKRPRAGGDPTFAFDGTCFWCGIDLIPPPIGTGKLAHNARTLDHFVCQSTGGTNRASNLGASCYLCNFARQAMPVLEFTRIAQTIIIPHRDDIPAMIRACGTINVEVAARIFEMITTRTNPLDYVVAAIEAGIPASAISGRALRRAILYRSDQICELLEDLPIHRLMEMIGVLDRAAFTDPIPKTAHHIERWALYRAVTMTISLRNGESGDGLPAYIVRNRAVYPPNDL